MEKNIPTIMAASIISFAFACIVRFLSCQLASANLYVKL